jgi:hypothetical protein
MKPFDWKKSSLPPLHSFVCLFLCELCILCCFAWKKSLLEKLSKELKDERSRRRRDEAEQPFPARLLHSGGVPQGVAANKCDATMLSDLILFVSKIFL